MNCFLGANSGAGFVSLYEGFASGPGDRLTVIKGGPGTGKSGFMRAIARAAEARGLDAELVFCSGDPDSLDGVYLPALRRGWVDGTAPHVLEPRVFGADGDYLDIGSFCRLPLSARESEEAARLNEAYKQRYRKAYGYLAAADSVDAALLPELTGEPREKLRKKLRGLLCSHSERPQTPGQERQVFLSAISCRGRLRFTEQLSELCPRLYSLDDSLGLASAGLGELLALARERGLRRIVCRDPLNPARLEALLLPADGLGFVRSDWAVKEARGVHFEALLPAAERKARRVELREGRRLQNALLARGMAELSAAKALHDELEALYRPHMDFAALDAFTKRAIEEELK